MALINTLNGIGDAIREKTGETEVIPLKEMADAILSISGGESVGYSSITYNEDGTVTLTQTNGAIRTMTCEYDGDKLVGLKYGNEVIPLTYEDDVLVGIGGMEVDMSNAPADTRLKELVENTLTELVDDTITSVKKYGFYDGTVQKVDLPNCTSVGQYAFSDCSALTNINLPSCVSLGKGALSGCDKLTSLVLPNCTTVGDTAFHDCDALERIDLGSVTKVGTKAFYSCDKLTTLIIRTNQVATVTDGTYLLSYTPISSGTGYIYVPDNLVEVYKGASGWHTYKDQIKGLSELEVVSNE